MTYLPRQRLRDKIQAELYVGGDDVRNRRRGPAKHTVLARALQVVVDDLERPRPVPTADGLRVGADLVDVGDVRIDYRRAGGIDHYAPPDIAGGVSVNIAAVEDQVVRRLSQRSLIAAERDDVTVVRSRRHAEFDSDEPVVMSGPVRIQHRFSIRSNQFGHKRAIGRSDARSGRRQRSEEHTSELQSLR